MELEEGDTILCTVDRIAGTNVFVKFLVGGEELEGSIVTSEIAAGRIRNLRDYVVPKKKIVCKVLRISGNRIDLSLRRVTPKEQKEVMNEYKLEKSYVSIIKSVLEEKSGEAIKKMSQKERLYDFFEDAKSNPEKLEKLVGKANSEKILKMINAQKKKNFIVKKEISLKSSSPDGLQAIKNILKEAKNAEVKYVSAGRYSVKSESSDVKDADTKLKHAVAEIERRAKKENAEFSIIEK